MDTFTVFRLEKFIPTHCPRCAHPFRSNGDGDFKYDFRLLHRRETPTDWLEVFPEAAVTEGLHSELIWCGQCHNTTLRVVTAVRLVATEREADALETHGYVNRQILECSGRSFSELHDYNLRVLVNPDQIHQRFTFMPSRVSRRPPRSSS